MGSQTPADEWLNGVARRISVGTRELCSRIGLDSCHFSEHAAETARACFGQGTPESATWREQVPRSALEAGPDEVLDEITSQRQRSRVLAKRESSRRLRAYVGERMAMMDYPACRAKGRDIGSSPTEGECKVLTARLKGPGMRWDRPTPGRCLALTAAADSGQRFAYWHGQGSQRV